MDAVILQEPQVLFRLETSITRYSARWQIRFPDRKHIFQNLRNPINLNMAIAYRMLVPESRAGKTMIGDIAKRYPIKLEPSIRETCRFYDTFDWLLYGAQLMLFNKAQTFHLHRLKDEAEVESVPWPSRKQPRFWWDFPESHFRQTLKSKMDVRALLPLFSIETRTRGIRILNKDDKTVLRVDLQEIRLLNVQEHTALVNTLILRPLRGYRKNVRKFEQFVADLGLAPNAGDILDIASAVSGKKPGDYSAKLNVQLHPEMPGNRAARVIFSCLLQIMRQNEAGIKADIDSEFLHDFRVAVRRTRSALSQIKEVLPQDVTRRFKEDFQYVGKLTNRLRDLDVYLLKEAYYKEILPGRLRPSLDPLFQFLRKERRKEHRKLVRALETPAYKDILENWESFLIAPPKDGVPGAKNAEKQVNRLAGRIIRKTYCNVVSRGIKITDASPDEELHALRIDCKKLRYSMEFFQSLFPQHEIGLLIRQLKELQNNLGDFNDLFVQQESLQLYLENLVAEDHHRGEELDVAAAIGGLIANLHHRQIAVRLAFQETFEHFNRRENIRLFRALFG